MDEAIALFREIGDGAGEANILWARGTFHYFRNEPAEAEAWFRRPLDLYRTAGQRTMEAWALHMLGTAELKQGRLADARDHLAEALRDFHESGDLSGVTLVLDDLSALAVAEGDRPRAGRLRGAARRMQTTTGTELAKWIDEIFEQSTRPNARTVLPPDELARFETEGAALTLDDLVAYARAGGSPADPGDVP